MNVIAPPKVGKSWLASDKALAAATGRPWLDRYQTEAADVLIIDNELHPHTTAHTDGDERSRDRCRRCGRPFVHRESSGQPAGQTSSPSRMLPEIASSPAVRCGRFC